MACRDRNMTGPFLCILACLFVLSITAPRGWQREQAMPDRSRAEAPQMPEPSTLTRTYEPEETDSQDNYTSEERDAPTAEPLELTAIPKTIAVADSDPSDPGGFAEARPARPYAERPTIVPPSQPDAMSPSTPSGPTLAEQVVPEEELAVLPTGSEPTPVEPTPVKPHPSVASVPGPSSPELRGFRLPDPISRDIESNPPDNELTRKRPAEPSLALDAGTVAGTWIEPETLLESLQELSDRSIASLWAAETSRLVSSLEAAVSDGPAAVKQTLQQLRAKLQEIEPLAASLGVHAEATKLRRVGHALRRRLDVWQQLAAIDQLVASNSADDHSLPAGDQEQLSLALAEIDTITADSVAGKAWREYLMFDALNDWSAKQATPGGEPMPRDLAQKVFGRLTQTPMSVAQREFITSRPMVALRAQLRSWAAEPVPSSRLLADLEQYERTELGSDAKQLAEDCLYLSLAEDRPQQALAARLQTHYRNANLRIAVTDDLMNRLMPERAPEYASVRDRVLDKPVHGKSLTSTDVAIRLLPDPRRVRLVLEVTGRVATITHSKSGPITFYNDSDAVYTARKLLDVDLAGIRPGPAQVRVWNNVRLRSMETDFDEIPLVGSLVQEVARGQHEMKQDAAQREIREKVAAKAKRRTDTEADERFGRLSDRLRDRVFHPLDALALEPTIIAAETTDERITMRLRLAGKDQLASHTPRPRAPRGSLASMQVHQSAINNFVERLELADNTYTVKELAQHIAARLNRPQFWTPDPDTEDVSITFAEKDPIIIRLQDGRLDIGLSIAKLSRGSRNWKDFEVRAFYRPEVDGRSIQLVRDGVVQLVGKRMSMGTRIAVRGIFSKTFSKNRPWKITSEDFVDHPKLSDLVVTQLTMEDGWLGVALGPERTAMRTTSVRR